MPLLPPGVHEHFPPDAAHLTPLFRQYAQIKREQPGALLLYRLGDFYELFGPDAVRAAELLQITLTSRACGNDYKVAMCGVPHHSAVRYIKRLVQAGEIVAICEQTQDPALAKGLVERAVTRVITAGTLIEDEYLSADANNFLGVVAQRGGCWGLALLESSGGRVELCELAQRDGVEGHAALAAALLRFQPAEVLLPEALVREPGFTALLRATPGPALHCYDSLPTEADAHGFLCRFFESASLAPFGLGEAPAAQAALFALVRYLRETFKVGEVKLYPRLVPLSGTLYLDRRSVEHLELLATPGLAPGGAGPSEAGLYGVLNRCATAGGRRELKQALLAPLGGAEAIRARHDAVEWLLGQPAQANALSALLARTQDVERIANRVALRRSHPKEVRALLDSLPPLSELGAILLSNQPDGIAPALLQELGAELRDFSALHRQLDAMLADSPPVKPADGGVIRPGADGRVDELRELAGGSREWFERYEQSERERTGIKGLKVKFTEAFGYFIEISKASAALAPIDYKRKQTLVSAERFTTAELTARETDVRSAESQLLARERELLESIYDAVSRNAALLAAAARAAALLDVLLCFAAVAQDGGWVRPELAEGGMRLELDGGRHPLVEQSVGARYYTPNACYLDQEAQQIAVLTGPNMGGKSTYLRMVAVLAVLCQCGSFVPALRAVLPVFDRVYTRVGAQDYLSRHQSTFMVEMVETAEILNTCTQRSLLILDEVGRGTSTYDGISIAKAVVEYLHELPARPLTLFATHFFELTDLPLVLSRVRNFQVEVAREGGRFVFLYRVAPGAASESFGIEVAALAGLPGAVVARARLILASLEEVKLEARERARQAVQLGLFGAEETTG